MPSSSNRYGRAFKHDSVPDDMPLENIEYTRKGYPMLTQMEPRHPLRLSQLFGEGADPERIIRYCRYLDEPEVVCKRCKFPLKLSRIPFINGCQECKVKGLKIAFFYFLDVSYLAWVHELIFQSYNISLATLQAQGWPQSVILEYHQKILRMSPMPWQRFVSKTFERAQYKHMLPPPEPEAGPQNHHGAPGAASQAAPKAPAHKARPAEAPPAKAPAQSPPAPGLCQPEPEPSEAAPAEEKLDTIENPHNNHTIGDQGCSWTTPLKNCQGAMF